MSNIIQPNKSIYQDTGREGGKNKLIAGVGRLETALANIHTASEPESSSDRLWITEGDSPLGQRDQHAWQ